MMNVAGDTSGRAAAGDLTEVQAEIVALGQLVNWNISYTVDVTLPDPSDPTAWDAVQFDCLDVLAGRALNASATLRREY